LAITRQRAPYIERNIMFDQFYTTLESLGIVPVVVLDKVEDAAPLAHALMAAGMKSAEVTFRTACAAECIAAMAEAEPEMCVGWHRPDCRAG
jgi:2-dehydro-3-deoxyphosphogluconate aldolase/(4S)-4-hydroxy-2-oxoglutarate aldolase